MVFVSDDVDLDELRDEFDADPGTQLDESPARDDDVDELVAALSEIKSSSGNEDMIGFRHAAVAALLDVVLEDEERANELGTKLDHQLGQESRDDYKQSRLAALAALVGVKAVDPELVEDLSEARERLDSRF